jgi:hypothetical protein
VATVIGIGLLVVGATTVFGELQECARPHLAHAGPRQELGLWQLLRTGCCRSA